MSEFVTQYLGIEVQLFVDIFPKLAANMAAIAKSSSCEKFDVGLSASNLVHNSVVTKVKYVQFVFQKWPPIWPPQ